MAGTRHTPEQIINKLRQAEVEIADGNGNWSTEELDMRVPLLGMARP